MSQLDFPDTPTEADLDLLWSLLRPYLNNLSVSVARNQLVAIGFDAHLLSTEQARHPLFTSADIAWGNYELTRKSAILRILVNDIPSNTPQFDVIRERLAVFGWQIIDGKAVRLGLLDDRDQLAIGTGIEIDISNALDRLTRGDNTGATTSACGAVDKAAENALVRLGLNVPNPIAAKVNTALQGYWGQCKEKLNALGVDEHAELVDDIHESVKHLTEAIRRLRRETGDAHGVQATTPELTYFTIRMAAALCGLLQAVEPAN
jgi:hypothetical protein